MDAFFVCAGPQHVIIEVNEAGLGTAGFDPRGMPSREAFPEYGDLQRLMDVCYRTGERQVVYLEYATWVTFRWEDGVVTAYRPHPAAAGLPRTSPQDDEAAA